LFAWLDNDLVDTETNGNNKVYLKYNHNKALPDTGTLAQFGYLCALMMKVILCVQISAFCYSLCLKSSKSSIIAGVVLFL
jgi:hypothetical protein